MPSWLDVETNEWITNPDHYRLPPSLPETDGLEEDIAELDAATARSTMRGSTTRSSINPSGSEETPAFIRYHEPGADRT